jgi:hypothetical protein
MDMNDEWNELDSLEANNVSLRRIRTACVNRGLLSYYPILKQRREDYEDYTVLRAYKGHVVTRTYLDEMERNDHSIEGIRVMCRAFALLDYYPTLRKRRKARYNRAIAAYERMANALVSAFDAGSSVDWHKARLAPLEAALPPTYGMTRIRTKVQRILNKEAQ